MFSAMCVSLLGSTTVVVAADSTVPFDAESGRWLFDPETIVSRNDVVYATPSPEPWEAMPAGSGDLSAMVRWDGSLHLHLTKADCWGFQALEDAPPGSRFFNNVSPGHLRLSFGPGAEEAARQRFRQRLDLYHGRVVVEVGEAPAQARIEVWGHPERHILVITVRDPSAILQPVAVELSEWRDTMEVGHSEGIIWAREVLERPAGPHLANTGMEDFYPLDQDPLAGRGAAVAVASPDAAPAGEAISEKTATMRLLADAPREYRIVVAASVTAGGEPLGEARQRLQDALAEPAVVLVRQHRQWWRDYWRRSFLRLTSRDGTAEWLAAAYHVHLYTLACTNRGPVPAKWDGGAGLMVGDQRNWGISEWVQEVRFTFLPLYAANRLDMARGLPDFYSAMRGYLRAQTKEMWSLPGLWIPETVTPWGHAEDFVLQDVDGTAAFDYFQPWDPETAPYGKFHRFNPYIGFLFTAGLEVCWHYLTYYWYSGDEGFLRDRAYPMIRDVADFVTSLLREGEDGRYHLDPANALETWWMVRDPSDTMDGLRAILPEFIALSNRYGTDDELRARCATILPRLPDPPRGLWREDSVIESEVDVYAPAGGRDAFPDRVNAENPQLYRVFPFGLSGIGSDDYDLARRTFERRICALWHGWSMDAIWAARLGLGEEARALLAQHARQFNRFRYGGWDSNDSRVHPDGLAAAPFLDAGGLSAFCLNEILLQSHGGVVRIAPAVAPSWSGIFRLLAEGGFLVAADIAEGLVRFAEIKSLRGGECTVANPWEGECILSLEGEPVLQTQDETLTFATNRGQRYLLECADRRLATWPAAALRDAANDKPGLPGRDT